MSTKKQPEMVSIKPRLIGPAAAMINNAIQENSPNAHEQGNQFADKCWDELHSLYAKCSAQFLVYAQMGTYLKNPNLLKYVPDPTVFSERIRILTADLVALKGELTSIYQKHQDKHGGLAGTKADDVAADQLLSIELFQHYSMWQERHDGTCLPTWNEITAAASVAEQRMKHALNQDVAAALANTPAVATTE